jgi:SpoIID/LytB domain protein
MNVNREPIIAVGVLPLTDALSVWLSGDFKDGAGRNVPAGEYRIESSRGAVRSSGPRGILGEEIRFVAADLDASRFSLQATIGVDFHWQQQEVQAFAGDLRVIPAGEGSLTAINDVPLEVYLASVTCSEMSASSPPNLVQAHAVVSRSWLLAQLEFRGSPRFCPPAPTATEVIRWYDREGHEAFDVCADDHCQRYHGIGRLKSSAALDAVSSTRGQALMYEGRVCDARYAKACGGVTEDFRAAWGDEPVPYLVPLVDGPGQEMPDPPLSEERAFRAFLEQPPNVYCNCTDSSILDQVLTPHDRATRDFFRWRVRLTAENASRLVEEKLGLGLGRIVDLVPVERGLSGRIVRLRVRGEGGEIVVGKELEVRRILSPTHLYSSAFAVDTEGPASRPDAFVLRGAGWGHGVGLCQIGAAAMAARDIGYEEILRHYYPGASLERLYL